MFTLISSSLRTLIREPLPPRSLPHKPWPHQHWQYKPGWPGCWRQVLSSVLPVLLLGCSTVPMAPGIAKADAQPGETDGQLMYELMIAELAGRRGYLDVATKGYLQAAERTDDPRVSARATQLSVFSQQWKNAEKAARRWLQLEPDATDPHELLAQIMLRQRKPKRAEEEFAALIQANSEDPGAVLAEIYVLLLREPDVGNALITMRGLADRYPQEVEAHLGVARLLLGQNSRADALVAVDAALAVDAANNDALLIRAQVLSAMGTPAAGFDELRAALDKDAGNVNLRLGYAQLLVDADRFKEAAIELDLLFEMAPDNSAVLLSIGLLALDSKRMGAASRYLSQLLETGEHADQAHFYLARISDQQKEFKQAIEHYEQVMPGDMFLTAQIRSAELYGAAGDIETGIERLHELAITLPDPSLQPQLLTAEGRMLQEAGRGKEAVQVLSSGLEQFPDNGDLLMARALAAQDAGDTDMLQADLAQLIDAQPDNAMALNALGYFLADEDLRLEEAEGYLEKATDLEPNDAAIMDSLGWLRYRQGKNTAAIKLLQEAYRLYPDGEIAAHLGELLWVSGDQAGARLLWEEALVESPDHDLLKAVVKRFTE